MTHELDLSADVIDVRDIIARLEEIEDSAGDAADPEWKSANPDDAEELAKLWDILNELAGYGGDEKFRGDWYPVTLIRDTYFQDYAEELANDIGAINSDAGWPNNCIDWERAARELQYDYTSVEIEGMTYWYR